MCRFCRALLMLALLVAATGLLPAAQPLPAASWTNLPPWRGFNLLNKFMMPWNNGPYREADFQFLAQHHFNFVRLPIDYRTYIVTNHWETFAETKLAEIDRAVEWGEQYGIHVCLNLHRIPGWTVASPAEEKSLWTDAEAQRVAAGHWAMFARRYRGIPSDRLSFNLLNEPPDVTPAAYSNVVSILVSAIRAEDPQRLVLCDGLSYASKPVPELIPLRVAQATRGYTPFGLTHYRASWVAGSASWPAPTWPGSLVNGYLYGSQKPELRSALRIEGPFPEATTLRFHLLQVSARSRLVVKAGSVTVTNQLFVPGPGSGDWKEVIFQPQWNTYQNLYDRSYSMTLPAGTPFVTLENIDGDWLTFAEIGLTPASGPEVLVVAGNRDWGRKQTITVRYHAGPTPSLTYTDSQDARWLWRETIQPWLDLRARGVGVMVGEWGAHSATPHAVTMAWMRDMLNNFENAGLGWALWNLEGSFGPVNSGRADVAYETIGGRKVDRAMWELLREYTGRREAYWRWQERLLPPATPAASREPTADAFGDGFSNFARYAMGLPSTGASGIWRPHIVRPSAADTGGAPEFRYWQSMRETGVDYRIWASEDLVSWEEIAGPSATLASDPGAQAALESVRLRPGKARQFVRLEFVAPPSP